MNRLSSSHRAPRPCAWTAFLLAVLSSPSLAQKPAAPPPAPTHAAPSVSGPSLALSQREALTQKQLLDADKRLDRIISLDVISVPLGEVLANKTVNRDTKLDAGTPESNKLALTASHNCEDLKLQIRLNHRPLRMLMTALAEMLPGQWTRTKEGYNLSLTDKAVIARAEWWRLFLGEREKALAAQRQAVLSAMQTKAHRRQADDPEPEPSDHAIEEEAANQHDFFFALPQPLKEQIAANLEETAFYEVEHMTFGNGEERFGTIGWLSQMSPETQERFKAAMQDYINNHLASAPPAYQKYTVQAQRELAAFDPGKVYFLFQNGGFSVLATPFNGPSSVSSVMSLHVPMSINLPALTLDQTRLADVVYGGSLGGPHWKFPADKARKMGDAATPEMKSVMYQVYGMGEAAPSGWKQLAAYQRSRVWPNTLPTLPPNDGRPQPVVISRAAQTDWLGEQGHMEYVCDYYSHGGYEMPPEQRKQSVKRPLATEMDEMAAKHDVSWKRDKDGIYLIRNNRWYRDDNLEVPQPLLRRWFNALLQARQREAAAQAAVPVVPQSPEERMAAVKQTWDWAAEVFSALTPWQMRNGLALFQPEEKNLAPRNNATAAKLFEKLKYRVPQPGEVVPPNDDPFTVMTRMPPFSQAVFMLKGYPHTAHLYGSLDDAGRAALLEGRLPITSLTPSQQAEAASLQPLLPPALQTFPPEAVRLSLPYSLGSTERMVFGETPRMRLEVVTPPVPPIPFGPQ